jgi:hypothetical protein
MVVELRNDAQGTSASVRSPSRISRTVQPELGPRDDQDGRSVIAAA